MATFAINTSTNFDQLSGSTGDDTYNINSGSTLTIDTDTRYCRNHSAALTCSLGNITINAAQGGTVFVDGTKVRMFQYTGGTGNVPAVNTIISQDGVSASLLTIQSALNVAPTLSGAAMPASGYIKVKDMSTGSFASGTALTGVAATASSADRVGWIEVHALETRLVTVPRLGKFAVSGAWYEVGVTTGVSSSTYQLPCTTSASYWAGAFIETSASSNVFEFYPNAGGATTTATTAGRGKVCWITSAGLLRLGSNNGTTTNGYLPPTGSKIQVPNVNFQNVTGTSLLANSVPNTTLATRYEFAVNGGGVIDIDKCNMAWYMNLNQAFSIKMNDCVIHDNLTITELATPISATNVNVALTPASTTQFNSLLTSLCFAGGTFTSCSFTSYTHNSSGNWTTSLTDMDGFTFYSPTFRACVVRNNATTGAGTWTRVKNTNVYNPKIVQGKLMLTTCANMIISGTQYADACQGSTTTTSPWVGIWDLLSNTSNVTIEGLEWLDTNVHPRTALVNIGSAGCSNVKVRNIGNPVTPLTLGSTNQTTYIFVLAAGAAADTVKFQRLYLSNTATGLWTGDNSSTKITLENVFGDYADSTGLASMLNFYQKGVRGIPALTAQTGTYGTHWFDHHTGTTGGRLGLHMNEATTLTSDQVTLVTGANFTSIGGLYMPTSGAEAYFTMPYYCVGHTGFQTSSPTMAGGTIGNYVIDYQIDKNDGSGFGGTWLTASAAAMAAITGISASAGFKLKLRIRTQTNNTTAINSLYYNTTSTTASQAYQYPLDTVSAAYTMTGIKSGSEVRIYESSSVALLTGTENILTDPTGTFTYNYTWSGVDTNAIVVIHALGWQTQRFETVLGSSSNTIPIQQVVDRQYVNPPSTLPPEFGTIVAGEGNGSSSTISIAKTPTSGNLLWAGVRSDGDTTITVTDDIGNSWSSLGSTVDSTTNQKLEIFTARAGSSSATSVTASFLAAQTNRGIIVGEISNVSTVQSAQISSPGNITFVSSSATLTTTPALCVHLVGAVANNAFFADPAWTSTTQFWNATMLRQGIVQHKQFTSNTDVTSSIEQVFGTNCNQAFIVFNRGT